MAINTTYTVNSATQASETPKFAQGKITYPATVIVTTDYTVVTVGFTPRYVRVDNLTTPTSIEWFEGMTANTGIARSQAVGDATLEVTGITICDADGTANTAGNSFKVIQDDTQAVIIASKVVNWQAFD